MRCRHCGSTKTRVIDSRASRDGFTIRRRRQCLSCKERFTTYEQVEMLTLVIKKDGARVPYDREKLRMGLAKACYKRPMGSELVDGLTSKIEQEIESLGQKEIESTKIGEIVMRELRQVDEVAYLRFASVYRDFKDASDFDGEINTILTTPQSTPTSK